MIGLWKLGMIFGMVVFLLGVNAQAADPTPDEVIRKTADEVIVSLKSDKAIQSGDRSKAYALIDQKILPHFDFTRMTRLAVGRYWNQATPEQQKKLVDEFRDLLVRTYASALSQYKDQVMQIKGTERQNGDTDAVVHAAVVPSGGQVIPMDYSMEMMGDGWKIYDIKVDGISLVTNYRSEFADVVRRSGVDGLIKALDDKRKQADKR